MLGITVCAIIKVIIWNISAKLSVVHKEMSFKDLNYLFLTLEAISFSRVEPSILDEGIKSVKLF